MTLTLSLISFTLSFRSLGKSVTEAPLTRMEKAVVYTISDFAGCLLVGR